MVFYCLVVACGFLSLLHEASWASCSKVLVFSFFFQKWLITLRVCFHSFLRAGSELLFLQ